MHSVWTNAGDASDGGAEQEEEEEEEEDEEDEAVGEVKGVVGSKTATACITPPGCKQTAHVGLMGITVPDCTLLT
jgi:hypothetical protein